MLRSLFWVVSGIATGTSDICSQLTRFLFSLSLCRLVGLYTSPLCFPLSLCAPLPSPTPLQNASFTAKQVADVASKVQKSRTDVSASRRFSAAMGKGKEQSEVQGAAHDASVASFSVMHGLMTQLIKHKVFNGEGPSA